jgi:hypothetical protein
LRRGPGQTRMTWASSRDQGHTLSDNSRTASNPRPLPRRAAPDTDPSDIADTADTADGPKDDQDWRPPRSRFPPGIQLSARGAERGLSVGGTKEPPV